jgi:NSS family neurotransmitter:Na+ symporter
LISVKHLAARSRRIRGYEPIMSTTAQWRSGAGFILAALGAAVGLGNVWRFSYVAGENGGGAFVVAYFLAVVALGLPLLIAELAVGRHAQSDPVSAFSRLAPRAPWRWAGWLGVAAAVAILSYYPIVAGWVASYLWHFAVQGVSPAGEGGYAAQFGRLIADPVQTLFWHGLVLAATAAIVALGVQRGIERACKLLMPLFAALLVLLAGYGLTLEGAGRALDFLFAPEWSALASPRTWLAAVGQAFFSIGLAMGILVTYGGYVSQRERLPRAALAIAVGDTAVALIAGLVVFPAVFTYGVDPAQGPTLAFAVLPEVFALMPLGRWIGAGFFLLLLIAALTSAVSLLEVPVALAIARRGWPRASAAWGIGLAAFALGVPGSLLMPWLDRVDRFASYVLLPASGIAIALVAGWAWPASKARRAADLPAGLWGLLWLWSLRAALPLVIALLMVGGLAGS